MTKEAARTRHRQSAGVDRDVVVGETRNSSRQMKKVQAGASLGRAAIRARPRRERESAVRGEVLGKHAGMRGRPSDTRSIGPGVVNGQVLNVDLWGIDLLSRSQETVLVVKGLTECDQAPAEEQPTTAVGERWGKRQWTSSDRERVASLLQW